MRRIDSLAKPTGQGAEAARPAVVLPAAVQNELAALAAPRQDGRSLPEMEDVTFVPSGRRNRLSEIWSSKTARTFALTGAAGTTLFAAACGDQDGGTQPTDSASTGTWAGFKTYWVDGEELVFIDQDGNGVPTPGLGELHHKSEFITQTPGTGETQDPATQGELNLMQFEGNTPAEREASAQRWAVDHLAGNDAWLKEASHWHLTQDGGLVFDIPSQAYGKEHVNLNMSSVKDQVMVQGYRNVWHDDDDAGMKVTRDAYVVVGEDSFLFRQATVWVYDHKLTPQELSQAGNEGYDGQVRLEATQGDQADVEVHAVGFNLEGFESCETIDANNPVSHLNVPEMPATEEAQRVALQAFANAVGTDEYTRDGSNYKYVEYGGIVLLEDDRPGVHHRIDLSRIANNVVIQTYQDVRLDGSGNDGWMRDAIVWTNDQTILGVNGEDRNHATHQMFVRRATFWGSVEQMNAAERQYNGQVAYYQQLTLERNDPTQRGVVTHPFGFQRPEPSPAC